MICLDTVLLIVTLAFAQVADAPTQHADRIYTSQEYSREVSEFVASIATTLTSTSAKSAATADSAGADVLHRAYGQVS